MKNAFVFCLFLNIAGLLFANDPQGISGFFGLGAETNANTREGAAAGGSLSFGMDLTGSFTLGLKAVFSSNFDTVAAFEPLVFARYYTPSGYLFVQAEIGAGLFFEDGENYPSFSGGLSAGMRFNILHNLFAEPHVRFGYPYIWGAGVTAGYKFSAGKPERQTGFERTLTEYGMQLIREDDNLRLLVPPIIFRMYTADFEGLDAETQANNDLSFRRITEVLNTFSDYRVVIEGHANPTTPEGPMRDAEEHELLLLSEMRAQKVLEELVRRGLDPERLTAAGFGSSRTIVPFDDHENAGKNRRVEFILYRKE